MTSLTIRYRQKSFQEFHQWLTTNSRNFIGRLIKPKNTKSLPLAKEKLFLGNCQSKDLFRREILLSSNNLSEELTNLIFWERFINGISARSNNPYATFTTMQQEYRPDSTNSSYSVPLVKLPKSKCQIYLSNDCNPQIADRFIQKDSVFFAVHPQVFQDQNVKYQPEIIQFPTNELSVSPSASSRTVFALDQRVSDSYCLKLHFPYQITRSVRHLEKRKIEHSVRITNDLAKSALAKKNKQFAYFPESLGVVYGNNKDSWGFLVRELTPKPVVKAPRQLIPLFALYSTNSLERNNPPLLVELIERSKMDPETYVLEKVMYPLLKCWVDVFLETGILIEAHGQNTCLELDETLNPYA